MTYDKEENLVETEGVKIKMEEVTEIKYLGFVISETASNVANITSKTNKSMGTIRNIMNTIQGLGTYTIQNGPIFFLSLLRSSMYACETYCNLKERNLRMLEGIEEDCLRKILKTGQNCSRSLLYLETGVIPAPFQIKIMMLNFPTVYSPAKSEIPYAQVFCCPN